ncbi:MAG: peptidylprolyl isomerase, partial [Bacteroidota bacterium]
YQKAVRLFQSVHAGADFAAIARDSSDDPSTREGGGRLPSYVTAGMILPSIEDAAYETKSGQVYPGLVRVPAGFVIVKVLDRSTRYKVRAAHILVAVPPNSDSSVSDASRRKAEDALARIRKGEDFAKVAKEVSDDKVSGENGGDFLVYYTRSLGFEAKNAKLEPAIEESLYRLKDGEVSSIIKTQYGYHIVKRLESRKPTFEEEKETIRQFYKQRLLAEDRAQFVRSVVDRHGMRVNEDIFGQMLAALNQNATTADTGWAGGIGRGLRGETLYHYGGANYTVGSWIDTVKARPELHSLALSRAGVRNSFYALHEQEAMTDEAKNLETEYPEFATLMQEFRDGILIFNLEDEMVWKRLNQGYDDAKGKAYFEKHRSKYMTPAKLGLTEILVYKEDEAKKLYEQGKSGSVPFDTLAARNTQRQGYRERAGRWEPAIAKNADLVKQVLDRQPNPKSGDILEPFSYQGGYSIIRVNSVEPAREMTYDEAKTEVQGDYVEEYQKQLQKEWLDTLRLKYHVKINDQTLRAALAGK